MKVRGALSLPALAGLCEPRLPGRRLASIAGIEERRRRWSWCGVRLVPLMKIGLTLQADRSSGISVDVLFDCAVRVRHQWRVARAGDCYFRVPFGIVFYCCAHAGRKRPVVVGGAEEARTPDPLLAKEVLSQLSYGPRIARTRRVLDAEHVTRRVAP